MAMMLPSTLLQFAIRGSRRGGAALLQAAFQNRPGTFVIAGLIGQPGGKQLPHCLSALALIG
jgi:hypothetical protein